MIQQPKKTCQKTCRGPIHTKNVPFKFMIIFTASIYSGAVIKCNQYSGITVESGTHVKSVKITLNILAAYRNNEVKKFDSFLLL